MNKNTVQRIFQLKGWQVTQACRGQRPRIEAKVSVKRNALMSVGRRICAESGAGGTVGWRWRS